MVLFFAVVLRTIFHATRTPGACFACKQVRRMVLCDRCGTRMPAVRSTIEAKIGRAYRGLDISLDCFPEDDVPDDPNAAIRVRGCFMLH
jgi:hypothetical protein